MELIGGFAMAGALWYGSREIAAGKLSLGEFTSFIAALFLMYGPAKKLSRVNANLQQAIAASERIFEMLDTHTEVKEKQGAPAMMPFSRAIEFRDVSFGYEELHGRTLRRVSFTVSAGQMIAIVGRSGAGKTTLVNLLPRFYDVTGGAILIDGVDIRDVTLKSLRSQIGIVTQETVLFDESVASNISYGASAPDQHQIEAAARAAHAHEFIMGLPHAYKTVIGERGQRLSGGQRQRDRDAGAAQNAPILVLDEATSALDTEAEPPRPEALANLMLNRVLRHRPSPVDRFAAPTPSWSSNAEGSSRSAATTTCWRAPRAPTRCCTRCSCSKDERRRLGSYHHDQVDDRLCSRDA
jgi:subfamily B ATP-binding cassette protein MsbA